MKKKILLPIVLLAIAAAAVFFVLSREKSPNDRLTLYGTVDIRSVDLAFRVGGRIAAVGFEEGDRVAADVVVARLDTSPYRDELDRARARRAQAKAQLDKFQAGSRPQEIARARARVAEVAATVENLERDFRRKQALVAEEVIPRQSFDDSRTRLAEGRARLATARQSLALAEEGFRAEDIAAVRADLQAAEAEEAVAETRLTDCVLTAPAGGVLLTRVEEPGAIVAPGQTVAVLSLDRPAWVRAYVDEPNLGRVHPGMPARIYTDSAPDKPYRGQVGFIAPEAEFTPKSVQTEELRTRLVYRVRVIAENPDQGLRQGMPVTVRLLEDGAEAGD
jgi:HlyD family secretion protein